MSEEEKVEYLRKKIKRIKRTRMIYNVLFIIGVVGFIFGLPILAFDVIIMAVALFVVSSVMGVYSNKRKNDLMEQLRKMGYKEKESS